MQALASNVKPTLLAIAIAVGLTVQCDPAGAKAPDCHTATADCVVQAGIGRGAR
ncbi:hypothetical protein R3X27_18145 [Tropicimonas sp. TH_r6]|uniref:hypothetical protein n=1 Tax=Tropicimonas sp. TH_r6 TaxID=3082085 RepID=UPI0029529D3F|nr:hypothetical protein [Tropicimonas sp. TH_r6]MDV7144604.1 hypothetical protein [Tropicimonas sp. TH_r6]